MARTGFCENPQFPAVFCENLCLQLKKKTVIPKKTENLQKTAKLGKETANLAPFVPSSLSLCPLDTIELGKF